MTESVAAGNRWAVVTPDDHSGILYVVTFLTFTYSNVTCIARYFVKRNILGLDDGALFVAQVVNYIQFTLLLISLSAGLGQSFDRLEDDKYSKMASTQFGNQVTLYVSLGISKIATVLLIRRLFPREMKIVWGVCNSIIVVSAIWTILAALLVSAGCSPASTAPTIASETCSTIVARYKFVVITDALIDVILVITPAYLCWQLQMSVMFKFRVLSVFAFRLVLPALAGTFLKTWIDSLSSDNPGVDRTLPITLQQCELCASIITATIPCVNSFLRSFDTGSGVKVGLGSSYGRGTNSNGMNSNLDSKTRHQESYAMSSLQRSQNRSSWKPGQSSKDDGRIEVHSNIATSCFDSGNKTSDEYDQDNTLAVDDDSRRSSRELIIRKDVHWVIRSEGKKPGNEEDFPDTLGLAR